MYCPKCGKKSDDDARFCAFCGEEIIDTQPEEVSVGEFLKHQLLLLIRGNTRVTGTAKTFVKGHRRMVLALAAVAVLAVAGIAGVRSLFNPERTARSFFEDYITGDWSGVYQELYLPDSPMLDEARFLKAVESWPEGEYLNYQVEPLGTGEDSLYLRYRFTYSTPGSTVSSQMDVTLVRTGKTALFFDSYRASLDGLIAEGCSVLLPEGASLILDGEPLETEMSAEGTQQICQLPQIFAGTHTFEMEHPVYRCDPVTASVGSGTSIDLLSGCQVDLASLEDPAMGSAADYLASLFDAAISGGSLDSAGIPLSDSSSAEADFREFQSDCASRSERRGTFYLTDQVLENAVLDTSSGMVECQLSYQCTSLGTELLQPSTFSGSARLTLTYSDGTWLLAGFWISNIY